MKFIHIADLHIGKSLHGFSLIENKDQPHWVDQFLELCRQEQPDAVLIAGDVYDRGAPGSQAVELLDRFLTALAAMEIPVLMVSGNHDSGTRLAFANALLEKSAVHIAGGIRGGVKHVTLSDAYGPVEFWLVPYIFPALVAKELGDEEIRDYDTAMRRLLEAQNVDFGIRNVIVTHQNVLVNGCEAERGGSETMVGGVGGIDYTAFDGFDYVALGHIHAAQPVGRKTVRYAGSPLCYHFSELRHANKGPVIITLGEKGTEPEIRIAPIAPLHPLREVTGDLQEVLQAELGRIGGGEYVRAVLTDSHPPVDAGAQLRAVLESKGSQLLSLDRAPKFQEEQTVMTQAPGERSVEELFGMFYSDRRKQDPDEKTWELIRFVAEQLRNAQDDSAKAQEDQIDAIVRFAMEQGE